MAEEQGTLRLVESSLLKVSFLTGGVCDDEVGGKVDWLAFDSENVCSWDDIDEMCTFEIPLSMFHLAQLVLDFIVFLLEFTALVTNHTSNLAIPGHLLKVVMAAVVHYPAQHVLQRKISALNY